MPALFDMNQWKFSPQQFLEEEKARVEAAVETGTAEEFLTLVPGKQCAPVAARELGMDLGAYTGLIVHALDSGGEGDFNDLHADLEEALQGMLPARTAPARQASGTAPAPG